MRLPYFGAQRTETPPRRCPDNRRTDNPGADNRRRKRPAHAAISLLAAGALLFGAHMVGAEVTELIQGYVVAMTLETTEEELMHTVFPHPTLSEMMHESVLDAYGRVIHT